MQEQLSDAKGRFMFTNLAPALYRIAIDSTQGKKISGQRVVADTAAGMFMLNTGIDVTSDSTVTVTVDARKNAAAGDTVLYRIAVENSGNIVHYAASVLDTLPSQAAYVSMQKGTFSSASYDGAKRIVQWKIDTLKFNSVDSAAVTVVVPRTIPDSTTIRNTVWYVSPRENVSLRGGAATMVRSLPSMHLNSYFAGRDSIAAGDSVWKMITYANAGTDTLRKASIVDTLFGAGASRLSLVKAGSGSVVAIHDSVVIISIGAIPPDRGDTVTVKIISSPTLHAGATIAAHTRLMQNGVTLDSVFSTLRIVSTYDAAAFFTIVKTANKKVAEIGDVVTYQLQLTNTFSAPVFRIGVYDMLPHAFKYVKKSSRFNGKANEPVMNMANGALTWSIPDTIAPGAAATVVYQLALGADALQSEGMNTAYASAEAGGGLTFASAASQWQVTVKPGVFTEKGLIIGKIFYDDNANAFQDAGENGISDVELWMEDGTRIVTGENGKFSVPEVKPGQHVLRVNERTLPAGTELLGGLNDFAQDPVSRFVRISSGGIAKANFFVKRAPRDTVLAARTLAAKTEKGRQPAAVVPVKSDVVKIAAVKATSATQEQHAAVAAPVTKAAPINPSLGKRDTARIIPATVPPVHDAAAAVSPVQPVKRAVNTPPAQAQLAAGTGTVTVQGAAQARVETSNGWMVYKWASGVFMVQVSSWEDEQTAAAEAKRFAVRYHRQAVLREHTKKGVVYHAVQFGPFRSDGEARAAIDECIGQSAQSLKQRAEKKISGRIPSAE
jgi:uncharacterized repeat protein (TIGR01451 family)